MILEKIARLRPHKILDVGCGCGGYTSRMAPYCGSVTAVDYHQGLIDRCNRDIGIANVTFTCMDGTALDFAAGSFDAVVERFSLHHSREWERIIDEMIRVSSRYVLVEEPLDDTRTEEKRNTLRARSLFLELHGEVHYPHYSHIPLQSLTGYFSKKAVSFEVIVKKSEAPLEFDEYFDLFSRFAEGSARKEYWYERLDALRRDLGGGKLCEDDSALIIASL